MSVSRNNMKKYFTVHSTLVEKLFTQKCIEDQVNTLSVSDAIVMLMSIKDESIKSALAHVEENDSSIPRVKSSKATPKKKAETTPKDDAKANAKAELVASLQEELAALTGKTGLEISETSIVKLRKQIQSAKVEINRAKRAAEKEKKDLERARVKAEKDAEKAKAKAEKARVKAEKDVEKARVKAEKDAEKARVKAEKAKAKAEKDAEKAKAVPKVSKKAQKIVALKKELATLKGVEVDSLTVEDKVLKIREAIREAKKANELAEIKSKRADANESPKKPTNTKKVEKVEKPKKAKKTPAPKPEKRLMAKKAYIIENIPAIYRDIFKTDDKIRAAKMNELKVYSRNIKLYTQCVDMGIRNVDGAELKQPHESSPKYYKDAIKNKLREE